MGCWGGKFEFMQMLKTTREHCKKLMQVSIDSEINMKDINKILAKAHSNNFFLMMWRNNTFLRKHVSMKLLEVFPSCLHFSLMFSEGEIKSPCFLQVWWALIWLTIWVKQENQYTLKYLIFYLVGIRRL